MLNPKIVDIFPDWYDGEGFFKELHTAYSQRFPWSDDYEEYSLEYVGNRSGVKNVSPLVDAMIKINTQQERENPEQLTRAQIIKLVRIVVSKFGDKWDRIYDAITAEYNPIHNYDMVEEETPDLTFTDGVSDDYSVTDAETHARNIERVEEATSDFEIQDERKVGTDVIQNSDSTTDGSVYGFNSPSPVPATEGNGSQTTHTVASAEDNTDTTTHTQTGGMRMTESGDAEDNVDTRTQTQTGYRERTETGKRTLTRSGNIGVTTSQQMIESEIKLREWNFIEQVYKDIDSVLTLGVYID